MGRVLSFLPSSFLLRLFPLFAVIDGMMVCGARARAEAALSVSVGDGRTRTTDDLLVSPKVVPRGIYVGKCRTAPVLTPLNSTQKADRATERASGDLEAADHVGRFRGMKLSHSPACAARQKKSSRSSVSPFHEYITYVVHTAVVQRRDSLSLSLSIACFPS